MSSHASNVKGGIPLVLFCRRKHDDEVRHRLWLVEQWDRLDQFKRQQEDRWKELREFGLDGSATTRSLPTTSE